jgi:hypothetical protein
LVQRGLTTAAEIEARANSALVGYIGNQTMLLCNIRDVVALARLEGRSLGPVAGGATGILRTMVTSSANSEWKQ